MANLKDIKRRIRSVKSTRKITYAMKLVAAAKLRKSQDAVLVARDYMEALNIIAASALKALKGKDYSHPLSKSSEESRSVLVVVIGGSRGLCGPYNTNIEKKVKELTEFYQREKKELKFILIGKKVGEFFRREKREYLKSYEDLKEDPFAWPLDEIYREVEGLFLNKEVSQVDLVYTKFYSAVSMQVVSEKFLPVDTSFIDEEKAKRLPADLIFEPSAEEVLESVISKILSSTLRQAALEAKTSENASRMVAMDNATRNAEELIHTLTLYYNRLRQSSITNEILDIVGGAEALRKGEL